MKFLTSLHNSKEVCQLITDQPTGNRCSINKLQISKKIDKTNKKKVINNKIISKIITKKNNNIIGPTSLKVSEQLTKIKESKVTW